MKNILLGKDEPNVRKALKKALHQVKARRIDKSSPATFFRDFSALFGGFGWGNYAIAGQAVHIGWDVYTGITISGDDEAVDGLFSAVQPYLWPSEAS